MGQLLTGSLVKGHIKRMEQDMVLKGLAQILPRL